MLSQFTNHLFDRLSLIGSVLFGSFDGFIGVIDPDRVNDAVNAQHNSPLLEVAADSSNTTNKSNKPSSLTTNQEESKNESKDTSVNFRRAAVGARFSFGGKIAIFNSARRCVKFYQKQEDDVCLNLPIVLNILKFLCL